MPIIQLKIQIVRQHSGSGMDQAIVIADLEPRSEPAQDFTLSELFFKSLFGLIVAVRYRHSLTFEYIYIIYKFTVVSVCLEGRQTTTTGNVTTFRPFTYGCYFALH